MFVEPGYYKDNDFGIRTEDVVVTVPAHTKVRVQRHSLFVCVNNGCLTELFLFPQYGHNYLTFDTVSLVPYDRKLIDTSLLSPAQVRAGRGCVFNVLVTGNTSVFSEQQRVSFPPQTVSYFSV